MSESGNSVQITDFATVQFDPYDEKSRATSNLSPPMFYYGVAQITLKVEHIKTVDDEYFDLSASSNFCSEADDVCCERIKILADMESIPDMGHGKWGPNGTWGTSPWLQGGGATAFSVENVKKIISADKIEIRYVGSNGYKDLDDAIEHKIQNAFLGLYHDLINNQILPDKIANLRQEKIALEKKEQTKLKLVQVFFWLGAIALLYYWFT